MHIQTYLICIVCSRTQASAHARTSPWPPWQRFCRCQSLVCRVSALPTWNARAAQSDRFAGAASAPRLRSTHQGYSDADPTIDKRLIIGLDLEIKLVVISDLTHRFTRIADGLDGGAFEFITASSIVHKYILLEALLHGLLRAVHCRHLAQPKQSGKIDFQTIH